ncbi:MAG: hypothetical protein ACR2M9_01225 [Cyanophyceae cyanobacterium]
MTLLEYVTSLQDQGLSQDEILSKTKDWKNKNKEEGEVVVSETVELDEVDLGTVKKKDGVPGAVAPSMGPQEAPQPVTEFGLEDTFSVSPAPEIKYNIDGKDVSKEEFDSYSKKKEKERKASEMDWLDRLGLSAKLGVGIDIPKMIASIPETLYDIASIPQNLAADPDSYPVALRPYMQALKAKGYLDFETSSKSFKEETGVSNPILDYYEEEGKELQDIADIYDNENYDSTSIYENFKEGNIQDGFKLLAQGLTRSAPVSLAMMAGGAVTTTGKLAAGSTIAFAGPEIAEQQELNPEQSQLKSIINGLGLGAAESVFESIGTGTLGKVYGDIIRRQGAEVGAKTFKDGLVDVYRTALVKYGAPASMVGEGVEEVATAITQNMIKGNDPFEGVQDAFLLGVGGGVMFGSPLTVSKAKTAVKQGITNVKINKELQNTEFNEAYEAFNPEFPTTEFEIKASQIPGSLDVVDKEVDAKVRSNDITNEQGNNIKNRAREVQGAVNQLKPLDVSVQNQPAIVDLMIEQKNLKNTIKQVDNASLTKAESARLSEIDTELGDLITKDKSEKIDVGAKKIAEEIGVGFESFETQEDVDSAIETLKEEGGEIDTKNSDNYGTFVVLPDGRRIIVLNKETATEDRTFTEGQHETAHAITYETVKNRPEAAIALGQSLLNEIRTNKDINIKPGFQARLDQYIQDADISQADTMEEVMTLVSDGLTDGTIEINETIGVKLGNFIRRALSAMGMKVKFKNGKDVLNFIKDYNRSVHKQKGLSKGLKKTAIEGAEVDIASQEVTDLKQSVAKESKRVEDSQEVQRLYDDQGVSAAFDIIQKFKPITNRIVESRSQAPNFDRELLTDEIETGPRGILDLITEYKSESGVPLAAYINKFLPARAIEASKRVLGEEFTTDVTEAKGVTAEETTEVETKEKPLAKKPTETVEFSQAQVEKIDAKDKAEVETRITEATNEAFKGQDVKAFGQTRNVPKAVADIYAGMFGLNPQTITDKTRNYQKTDAEGLTTAKQFLLKNANNDFARLPKTKDGFGKGTFLPRNVMNALYTDSKLTGTLKDYIDLIRRKPVKPIYRDAVGQTIRGLLNLHIRNRMFEDLVTTTPERLRGGAKFSKRKAVEDINIFIENQAFEKVSDELAAENKRWGYIAKTAGVDFINSKNPEDVKKMQNWVVNVLAPRVPKSFFTNGTFANAGISAAKRNFFFTSGLVKKDGTLGELGVLLKDAVFAKENENINKAVTRSTYVTGGKQGKISKIFIKKFNSDQFKKEQKAKLNGLKDVFKVFETLMKEDKNNTSFIIALLSSTSQGMGHFVRTSAPIKFYAKDVSSGIVEEHTMPASLVAKYLFNSAFAGTLNKDFKGIEKNYFQGALPYADDLKLKGKKPNGKPFNYTAITPEGWKITDNIWARYFNINVANTRGGIDPSNIVLSTGKTVFETFNITTSGLKLNEQGVKDVPKVEKALDDITPKSMQSKTRTSAQQNIFNQGILDNALNIARRPDAPVKKIRVFDFDDTLAKSKSMVIVNMPDGSTRKINATEFAAEAANLETEGAKFDFSEFSKVVDGKKGPLFSVAQKIAAARGTDDIFILTARPQDAAGPIQEFMKANGIDIPLANITGLGDGTAAAKGRWIASKAAEGYNDFYFADDAIKNVQAVKDVLSQVDVKSKVQQAKASKRITFDKVFNDIIEAKTGIESYKQFSAAKAKTVGSSKGKFTFFTTPSAEDFLGLLYKTLGKGKVGDAQMAFYKTNLLDPYNRAEIAISQAKVAAGRDYKALKKQFKNIPKTLEKETGIAKYTYQHAIRTYIWNKQGIEVPGLSKRDQKRLTDFIANDAELSVFADNLITIQKGKPYPSPSKDWTAGTITTDVIGGINKVNRKEYLQEWQENVDIIFSDKNMNKLEAAFGAKYVEALKDSLRSMKSGSNRPLGGDRVSDGILDWLNNSVGAIMFLNTRSAVLQTISAVNFVNWGDNNILKAGKAFANQKQFWGDFLTLMNSDYLLERRDGLKINVSESEIADAVQGSKNKVNAAISFLLNKGFVFTRYADSFAIASGGATFYRNRTEALVEQGMDRKAAEEQAFNDFRAIAEENQQSSSPSKISQQQRSLIGRIILQFGNTQLQYVRIQKRAVQDLVNKRGDWKSNISKIVYYGAIQNLMFNALQSGLAWALFDDDEEDEKLTEANKEQKLERALNGAIDSQLKGLGIQGAVIAGVKNALITIAKEADKKSPKFEEALDDLLSIAPALGSKIRKIKSAARTVSWNRKEIKEKGFSMDNPAYLAGAQVISAAFNIPLDRAVMKMNNMRNILNPATENWQKVALALGWSGWDVGLPYFGLAEDKPVLTETEKQTQKLFDLNKSDQVKMLLDLGLTKKEIRALTKEQQRVDQIIKLQNKKK